MTGTCSRTSILLKNKHDIYRLYGGFRYAFTTFKYDIERESPLEDPVWGGSSEFVSLDNSGSCHWLEACFGVDVKVAGPFRMGWSIRYRRRLLHSEGEAGDPFTARARRETPGMCQASAATAIAA